MLFNDICQEVMFSSTFVCMCACMCVCLHVIYNIKRINTKKLGPNGDCAPMRRRKKILSRGPKVAEKGPVFLRYATAARSYSRA
jgi:hypothetical protein